MRKLPILILFLLVPSAAFALDPVEIDVDGNTAVDISFGGTNAQTTAQARVNLGAQAASPTLDYWSTITPTSFGASLLSIESVEELGSLFGAGTEFTACDNDGDIWVWDDTQHLPVCESTTEITAGPGIAIAGGQISFPLFSQPASEGNTIVYQSGAWAVGGITGAPLASQVSISDFGSYYESSSVEGALQEVAARVDNIEVAGSYTTVPYYSDTDCDPGTYAMSTTYAYFCVPGRTWKRVAFAEWSNPTPAEIYLSSATISEDGTIASLLFSESAAIGAGGSGGWSMDCDTTGAVSMTYDSGDGSATLVYDLGDTPAYLESCAISYVQPTDGIEDSGGDDLASITDFAATNTSMVGYTPPPSDTCAGELLFYTSFENSFDPTEGTPAGCWDASLSFANSGLTFESSNPAAAAGTYSIATTHSSHSASYDVSSLGINTSSGTLSVRLYQEDLLTEKEILVIDDGGTVNRILIQTDTTNADEVLVRYRSSGEWTSLSSVGCDLTADAWHYIRVSWQTTASPYLSITCHEGGSAVTTNGTTPISGGAWSGPSRLFVGSGGGEAVVGNWDELKVYDSNQE